MIGRKYKTIGNVNYVIDKKGKLYIDNGKVKRSKDIFYYEIMTSVNGGYWCSYINSFSTRAKALDYIKSIATI